VGVPVISVISFAIGSWLKMACSPFKISELNYHFLSGKIGMPSVTLPRLPCTEMDITMLCTRHGKNDELF
jgi:hypothetical protein